MDVEIDHHDAVDQPFAQQHARRYGDVVEHAEPGAIGGECVVAAARGVAGEPVLEGEAGGQHRAAIGGARARGDRGRDRQPDAAHRCLVQAMPEHGVHVLGRVRQRQPLRRREFRHLHLLRRHEALLEQMRHQPAELAHGEAVAGGHGRDVGRVVHDRQRHGARSSSPARFRRARAGRARVPLPCLDGNPGREPPDESARAPRLRPRPGCPRRLVLRACPARRASRAADRRAGGDRRCAADLPADDGRSVRAVPARSGEHRRPDTIGSLTTCTAARARHSRRACDSCPISAASTGAGANASMTRYARRSRTTATPTITCRTSTIRPTATSAITRRRFTTSRSRSCSRVAPTPCADRRCYRSSSSCAAGRSVRSGCWMSPAALAASSRSSSRTIPACRWSGWT